MDGLSERIRQAQATAVAKAQAEASKGGRARTRAGTLAERIVKPACEWYEQHDVAVLSPTNPSVVGRQGRLRFAGKGRTDWLGFLAGEGAAPGRGVAFDVKSVGKEASYRSDLEPRLVNGGRGRTRLVASSDYVQLDFLLRARRVSGALCFLLLYSDPLHCCWILLDLETLFEGGTVPIRTLKAQGGGHRNILHHLPVVLPSDPLAVSRDRAPTWDFLTVARRAGAEVW